MRPSGIRALLLLILAAGIVVGCMHSHVINVTVTNTSAEKVSAIVIDYPEATFGINSLDPGKSFEYQIKPTATGTLKIQFSNAHGVNRVSAGPVMHKNDEGSLRINVSQDGAVSEIHIN
ncbi:MAG TPA: hypothetical protein VJA94_11240 [Candidatus Angelobacter sp.]